MAVLDLGKVVPEKGVDYFTQSDINEIVADVKNDIKVSDLENDAGYITKSVNDLTNYTLAVDTGHSIDLSINTSTYVMTLDLKNSAGTTISTDTVDLPLESVVVNGSYDSTNKKLVLTLQSGSTIDIPVGDLINGLQSEITSNNKLSSDLVDDTNKTNKFVTTSEKTTWNGKQDILSAGNNIAINNNTISATGIDPTVTTSSTSTYTIASLTGNNVYKLGEITSLTITAVTTFDKESVIYFESGSTATSVSIPDSLTNLGNVPTLTTSSNVSTGTCTASKNYIISVLNNIAVWKEY